MTVGRVGGYPVEAVIFDTDGVVTKTADVHMRAWKRLFDDFLEGACDGDFAPFGDDDYRRFVDGRPRLDGIVTFLASRGITIPTGSSDDPPGYGTVHALGAVKNGYFLDALRIDGVNAYGSTVDFVERLRETGIRTAVISASRNCAQVLESAGVADLFEVRIDGVVASQLGLAGKPDPAVFLEAARRLGIPPGRAAVVEDAIVGVEAGRRGGFCPVIGVDRTGNPEMLALYADIVVPDLSELDVEDQDRERGA